MFRHTFCHPDRNAAFSKVALVRRKGIVYSVDNFEHVRLYQIYIDKQMTISLGEGLNLSSYLTLGRGCFPFYTVYVCVS